MTHDLSKLRLHLVGCGKMGSALLKGWLSGGVKPEHVLARVNRESSAEKLRREFGIKAGTDITYDQEDVVLLAVKPQIMPDVLAEYWNPAPAKPLYLSVAAGIRLEKLQEALGEKAAIIRAMPNTPALIGAGVTSLCSGEPVTTDHEQLADRLFKAVGATVWLDTQRKLNAATAIAGSGPAYVFYFAESLQELAVEFDLAPEAAAELVKHTVRGSIALADEQGWDLPTLRQNVTSRGGVTEAALKRLMDDESGLKELLLSALMANLRRTRELG